MGINRNIQQTKDLIMRFQVFYCIRGNLFSEPRCIDDFSRLDRFHQVNPVIQHYLV